MPESDPQVEFNEENLNWSANQLNNMAFLWMQQNYHNYLLHARGHVFLNDVYDALGLQRTQDGAVTGWYIEDALRGTDLSATYIAFGLPDYDEVKDQKSITLTFNVTGVITDKI